MLYAVTAVVVAVVVVVVVAGTVVVVSAIEDGISQSTSTSINPCTIHLPYLPTKLSNHFTTNEIKSAIKKIKIKVQDVTNLGVNI